MRLWDYAVAVYGRPEVRAACLALQDDHGQCVSLLLWRAWAVAEGRALSEADLAAALAVARAWEAQVSAPLRSARRALRLPPPEIGEARRAELHDRVLAIELEAERALLDALEARTPPATTLPGDLTAALTALAAAWRPGAPASAITRLILALPSA